MAIGLGGGIGVNIVNEKEPLNDKIQHVGMVGSAISMDNAPAVEIRGHSSFNLNTGNIDFDYYQAQASWHRQGYGTSYDTTPIESHLSVGAIVRPDQIAGFVMTVWDAFGNVVFSGFDFIVGSQARQMFGEEGFAQFEAMDTDFVRSPHQAGLPLEDVSWHYPPTVGYAANSFVVGVAGFAIDLNGSSQALDYTLNWSFG